MSHWTVCRIKIKNPNIDILKNALEAIAKELGVPKIAENYMVKGYGGRRVNAVLAIPMRLPYGNGFGVVLDNNGNISVVADDHGAPITVKKFSQKLTQYYTTLAVVYAAKTLGFNVQNFQQVNQGVLIDLVSSR